MTRKRLKRCFLIAIGCYAGAIALGILLKTCFPAKDDPVYATYKDLVPFVIAIPAAWLGLCVQQRNSYMQQLRKLWSDMVTCVQEGIGYTFLPVATEDKYASALSRFSCVIEEVRGVFKNVGEAPENIGLYPFEALKEIRQDVIELGCGDGFTAARALAARKQIIGRWKLLRDRLLREFDRDFPTYPQSRYLPDEPRRAELGATPNMIDYVAYSWMRFFVAIATTVFAVVTLWLFASMQPSPQRFHTILLICWTIGPPIWFFVEYYCFDTGVIQLPVGTADKKDFLETVKMYAESASRIWAAVLAIIALLYARK